VDSNMNNSNRSARKLAARKPECGFMMLEVVISGAILVIGLVALLAVFSLSVAATQSAQEDMIAKQVASEAMESLFADSECSGRRDFQKWPSSTARSRS